MGRLEEHRQGCCPVFVDRVSDGYWHSVPCLWICGECAIQMKLCHVSGMAMLELDTNGEHWENPEDKKIENISMTLKFTQ